MTTSTCPLSGRRKVLSTTQQCLKVVGNVSYQVPGRSLGSWVSPAAAWAETWCRATGDCCSMIPARSLKSKLLSKSTGMRGIIIVRNKGCNGMPCYKLASSIYWLCSLEQVVRPLSSHSFICASGVGTSIISSWPNRHVALLDSCPIKGKSALTANCCCGTDLPVFLKYDAAWYWA